MTTCYAGIDLAWGDKARTGIAVLDDRGRLQVSASLVSDAQIDAFLAHLPKAKRTIAAIDAPLIVTNETGQRPCEREIARHFGRYNASAHTCNLSRPYMSPLPRGHRLATRWNWAFDPNAAAQGLSCAIEVYPHPAMISLFGLERVIPYKYKTGRGVDDRKAAFARLMELMEAHLEAPLYLSANERWLELKTLVDESSRQVHLDRIEDEVDAIFCAHLAWLWGQRPSPLVVFGDLAQGFIATLPPPGIALGATS